MNIAICIGTKAEYIKMFPLMLELDKRKIDYTFISTGQHDFNFLIKKFKTKYPDIIINQRNGFKGNTSNAVFWAISTTFKLIKIFNTRNFDYILVHGDTLSTFISSIAAKLSGKKICHIEAGLRSGNLFEPFPEELIRIIVDFLSDIKFTPSAQTAKYLSGISINVGNTGFESFMIALKLSKNIKTPKYPYAICTIHRHENIKSKKRLKAIISILKLSPIPVLFFIHDNTIKKIKDFGLYNELINSNNIKIFPTIDYVSFSKFLYNARFVFTDGGSISEEASYIGIPCIILRNTTERVELLNRGDQVLTKMNIEIAKNGIDKFIHMKRFNISNPYIQKQSSKKIINFLKRFKK